MTDLPCCLVLNRGELACLTHPDEAVVGSLSGEVWFVRRTLTPADGPA